MKKALVKIESINKKHENLYGDLSELIDQVSSGLTGDISPMLTGDLSWISGDATGIEGNLDDCELTARDRARGINIRDLIEQTDINQNKE